MRALRTTRPAWCLVLLGFCSCWTPADPAGPPPPPPTPETPHRVVVLRFGEKSDLDEVPVSWLKEGMKLFQFTEGPYYRMETIDLDGDPDSALSRLEEVAAGGSDLIVVTHPDALRVLASRELERPLVFGVVGDPLALGVGETAEHRSPGLTGAFGPPPASGLLTLVKFHLPGTKRVGVAFDGAEPLSVAHKDALVRDSEGMELEVIAVDVGGGDGSLAAIEEPPGGPLDAVCLTVGLGVSTSPLIERATRAKVPVFGHNENQVRGGALAAQIPKVDRIGLEAGRMVYRVLSGEAPAEIPLARVDDVETVVNLDVAKALGIELSAGALRISRAIGGDALAPTD